MAARLEAVSGPAQGNTFALTECEITLGRDPSNGIAILDRALSRRHCLLRREGERLRLQDLESRNGVFVNGVPIQDRLLEHADQIRVGNSVLVFLGEAEVATESPTGLRLEVGSGPAASTVVLRKEDAVYLKGGVPASARAARDLNALLAFSRSVNEARGLDAVQRKALECALELVPADGAAMLLSEPGSGEFASITGWSRQSGANPEMRVSHTIARRVVEEGVAVLSNDVASDATLCAESVLAARARSVLAVPLEAPGRPLGVLYLDASSPGARFDSDHLQLLTAAGNLTALAIEHARRLEWLEGENLRLREEIAIEHSMVGESAALREVQGFVARVAARDSTVLITGESGTGKELVARAIHGNSARAGRPFVAINCAAIADTLLESELFGHERGAFTGAVGQKKGKLEAAEGGTVFLDEIGELAPLLQAKLLRVLQEREFERVGGTRTIQLDIRLLAATNRDLKAAVAQGAFRQDLYYRLNVVSVRVPALRERREDIPLLAAYFAARYGEKVKRRILGISPKARACLIRYDWPGNVRELENAIERAVVLGSSDVILPEDLPECVLEEVAPGGEPVTALHEGVRESKRQLILKAIEQAGGNYTEAAALLGVHPNHLFRLVRTLNLKPKRGRATPVP